MNSDIPQKQTRAVYTDSTIRVYQAYGDAIADAALAAGTFVPPFKTERMTWIKPSFLWMMYRAGWSGKDEGQKRILAIDICREGFEWALRHACLSHPPVGADQETWRKIKAAHPVRIQWDPERNLKLEPLTHRSIQIGLSGEAVVRYANGWIRGISDITGLAHQIRDLVGQNQTAAAQALLPAERVYPFDFYSKAK